VKFRHNVTPGVISNGSLVFIWLFYFIVHF
jgi:hypothetical protein